MQALPLGHRHYDVFGTYLYAPAINTIFDLRTYGGAILDAIHPFLLGTTCLSRMLSPLEHTIASMLYLYQYIDTLGIVLT